MISNPTPSSSSAQASSLIDPAAATTMTPASNNGPCSDHSYELPLRRNLLLLLDLLDLLRFFAAVLLDRLGIASCENGGVQLPGQTWWWRGGECADDDDDAAVERFIEAMFYASPSPVTSTTTTRSRTAAAVYRRRRPVADDKDGGKGAAVCAICLAGLDAGGSQQTVAELGVCSHAFHAACIDAWAGTGEAATCPLCRAPMSLPTAWDDGRRATAELVPR